MPIVATDMGVQGSGLNDYFKAETKEEWISTLNKLDRQMGKAMAAAAFKELESVYSPKAIGAKAFDSVMN